MTTDSILNDRRRETYIFYMAFNMNCDLKQTFTPHTTCIFFFLFCQRHRDFKLFLHVVAERNLILKKVQLVIIIT